ncbi:hypothetical protein PVAP13_3KG427100 [Panicum virgatum]|uniref:Uncharacterized protein n=1 Tax=Panicum virgatum TaxID=38727 RepID=A0A8T0V530_PANVG|nr:hypothetical protein PVAP13_3KG427100 [Panicum virgatum]
MLAHGQELWIWPVDIRKGILIVVVGLGEGTAAVAAHVRSAPLDLAVCTFSGATAGEEKAVGGGCSCFTLRGSWGFPPPSRQAFARRVGACHLLSSSFYRCWVGVAWRSTYRFANM